MEGEINNLVLVWTTIVASLCYCHTIAKVFPSAGIARSLAIFPIVCLFFVLPLNLTSIHFGAITCVIISWLASFKLILFAFEKGPLYSNPPTPMARFIPLSCFPIALQQDVDISKKTRKSPLNYAVKAVLLALLIRSYDYRNYLHPKIVLSFYFLHIYLALEIILALLAVLAKALVRVELEPQFNEPYLATSLQDFWGRRWNLMVSNVLRQTVYQPVRSISARLVERKWAMMLGILATFFVSGLMHELVIYNIGRSRPTGEMMAFFLVHGLSLSVEIVLKKKLDGRFSLPRMVSGPLTLAFVMFTTFRLFLPPFLRAGAEFKGCTEALAFVEFVKNRRLVSPSDLSCPQSTPIYDGWNKVLMG